jgi:putative hydrolase of the HAD superfamily
VKPQECVFLDDLEQNVLGARAVGMEALVHRNADTTVPRLEALLGLSLRERDMAG